MKYLKYFENNYEVGDFVIIDLNKISGNSPAMSIASDNDYMKAKIIKINNKQEYPYNIQYDGERRLTVDKNEILRKLTPEEIEEYKIEIQAKKYNL